MQNLTTPVYDLYIPPAVCSNGHDLTIEGAMYLYARSFRCRECITDREYTEEYYSNQLYRKYGVTLEQVLQMEADQNSECAGCHRHITFTLRTRNLEVYKKIDNQVYIDHCHTTGKVRGLLCRNCNLALGHVKDNTGVLKNLIGYLTAAAESNSSPVPFAAVQRQQA